MDRKFKSGGEPPNRSEPLGSRILVWDAPTRIFHWLLVFCFAGAYLSADSDSLRLFHVTMGYTMAGLIAFRILWGLVGTRYARFSNFVQRRAAIMGYLRSLASGHPDRYIGHNPAGGLMVIILLIAVLVVVLTGWANYHEVVGDWMEEVHETLANILLSLIAIHIAGVLVSSRLHHENLIAAMLHGHKPAADGHGIPRPWFSVALAMIIAVGGFWLWRWVFGALPN